MWDKQKHKYFRVCRHTLPIRLQTDTNSIDIKTMHKHIQTWLHATHRTEVMLDPDIIVVQCLINMKFEIEGMHCSLSFLANALHQENLKKRETSHLEKPSDTKGKSYMENLECSFLKRFPRQYFSSLIINHSALKNILDGGARRCCERAGSALLRLIGQVP